MKKFYQYILLFVLCLITVFILFWQIKERNKNLSIDLMPFVNNEQANSIEKTPIACQSHDDCHVGETVVHCPAEARCVNNFCQIYCVYDDINDLELFSVSDCLDDIEPLSVRPDEYQLKWLTETDLKISFNIVLACNIDSISGAYELDDHNQITLNYEYFVKGVAGPCLCVRKLKYRIPNLNDKENYKVIINKIEK